MISLCGALMVTVALLSACSKQPQESRQPVTNLIERIAERGPMKLIVRAQKPEITVGEKLSLTVEVLTEQGVEVQMPELKEKIGGFEIVEAQTPPDVPENGKRRWIHSYGIRTLDAGDIEIPSISVKFTDRRDKNAQPIEGEISTDAFTVNVQSLLTGEPNDAQLRDIKGAVEVDVPFSARQLWPWVAALGFVAVAVLLILWLVRRRRIAAGRPVPELLPHLWAYQQLAELGRLSLLERGEFDLFFYRLSTIVRQYIERRFAILAAEQTTDEFLRDRQTLSALGESHRNSLRDFLRLADMVKFARFIPTRQQGDEVFAAAREFVEQTAPRPQDSSTNNGEVREVHAEAAA